MIQCANSLDPEETPIIGVSSGSKLFDTLIVCVEKNEEILTLNFETDDSKMQTRIFGAERVKSAIKAKLVELGAYVDDELPDYIMVMVANKKTQTQMTEDLALFLGTNTEKFTAWLHNLLKKLQSITTDPPGKEKAKTKEKHKSEKKRKSSSDKSTSGSNKASSSSHQKTPPPKVQPSSTVAAETSVAKPKKAKTAEEEKPELLVNISENTDEFSEELKEEESKKPVPKSGAKVAVARVAATKQPTVQSAATVKQRSSSVTKTEHQEKAPVERQNSAPEGRKKPISVVGSVKRRYEELEKEEEEYDPYNPAVGSVASVIQVSARRSSVPKSLQANKSLLLRAVTEAEKSVTSNKRPAAPQERTAADLRSQRETRVPASLRGRMKTAAGLQLISRSRRTEMQQTLKYTADEEGDTSKYAVKSPPLKVRTEPVEFTVTNLPAKFSIKGATKVEKLENLKCTVTNERVSPQKRKAETVESESAVKKRTISSVETDTCSLPPKQPSLSQDSKALPQKSRVISPVKRASETKPAVSSGLARLATSALKGISQQTQQTQQAGRQVVRKTVPEDEEEDEGQEVQDSRRVQCAESPEAVSEEEFQDEPSPQSLEQPESPASNLSGENNQTEAPEQSEQSYAKAAVDPEIQQLLDQEAESDFDLQPEEDMEQQYLYTEDQKRVIVQDPTPKADPRFIVTLDGVDHDTYEQLPELMEHTERSTTSTGEQEYEMEEQVSTSSLFEKQPPISKIPVQKYSNITPPKIKPFNISLKDTDDEEEMEAVEEETSPTKESLSEKCKFWPACANGNSCPYIHPSVPCKTFPYCKFGDKCLYIHPNCKWDAKCTRPDCPYTHASRRGGVATVVHKIVQVPVQPRVPVIPPLSRREAPECRFFPNCLNMSCPFSHPKPCRYGLACMHKSTTCPFYHPALPTKDKMKWSSTAAKKEHISARKFDSGPSKPVPTPTT